MDRVQDQTPSLTEEEQEWIAKNVAEQQARHAKIVAEMVALAPERDAWIDAFFGRLQTRGFNHNGDALTKIDKDDIPKRPNRPFKVNF